MRNLGPDSLTAKAQGWLRSVVGPLSLGVYLFVVGDEVDQHSGEREAGDYDQNGYFHPKKIGIGLAVL